MTLNAFILVYAVMVLMGSCAATGWFMITRGHWDTEPDGTLKARGKVFKHWYLFWNRKKEKPRVTQYKWGPLKSLIDIIEPDLKRHIRPQKEDAKIYVSFIALNIPGYSLLTTDAIRELEAMHKIQIKHFGSVSYHIFAVEEDYIFPEWVRDPLANCATCFASVYGSLIYWTFTVLVCGWFSFEPLFSWSAYPAGSAIFFWLMYMFSQAVLNTALAKKYNS